jgi:hypothetical protein
VILVEKEPGSIRHIFGMRCFARYWPILLQNSKVAGPQIFRKKTEREVIAHSYNLNRITKVACEFVATR